jgi:hypothetical protein
MQTLRSDPKSIDRTASAAEPETTHSAGWRPSSPIILCRPDAGSRFCYLGNPSERREIISPSHKKDFHRDSALPIDQSSEQRTLVRHGSLASISVISRCVRHPSAVWGRLMTDLNCPPVLQLHGPGFWKSAPDFGGHSRCPGDPVAFGHFRQRRAWTNVLGRKAIYLRVTAVAQDQPPLAVEKSRRPATDCRSRSRGGEPASRGLRSRRSSGS